MKAHPIDFPTIVIAIPPSVGLIILVMYRDQFPVSGEALEVFLFAYLTLEAIGRRGGAWVEHVLEQVMNRRFMLAPACNGSR